MRSDGSPGPSVVPPALRERWRGLADPDGFLPFDRYVELALYTPGAGYYARPGGRFGRAGDFYTASHVHALYGATLAGHLVDVWTALGSPEGFEVAEVGSGDGTLAGDILDALGQRLPTGAGWEYVLVERSGPFRAVTARRLAARADGGPVTWRQAASLGEEGPIRGVVLANELLDALPFRRLRRAPGGWVEEGVELAADGTARWASRPLRRPVTGPPLPAAPDGTVLEVSDAAAAWLREVGDHLADGRALLVDYGADESDLVRRGGDTLEAIRAHRRVDPLTEPGATDLGAWVDFTRARAAAASAGLREVRYGPLSAALAEWGIDARREEMQRGLDAAAEVQLRLAEKSFLFGFETFRVLELAPVGSRR